jgi:hypothetical protein
MFIYQTFKKWSFQFPMQCLLFTYFTRLFVMKISRYGQEKPEKNELNNLSFHSDNNSVSVFVNKHEGKN